MQLKINIILGKIKIFFYLFTIIHLFIFNSYAETKLINEKYAELNILDKVSSKSSNLKLEIGKDIYFQNLIIKVLKCNNSEFDDDPEIIAYMQVIDIKTQDKDKVFVFNGWTFSSSPSINPFDHPVYDIWLKKCYS
tara:strand:- start:2083 stop:2490 length:408 start_codon:yes stop_codon:yes gene_type:complete